MGNAKIYYYRQNKLFKWATKIAQRYIGKDNAEAYGNSTEGEVLVRIKPRRIIAEKNIAVWD